MHDFVDFTVRNWQLIMDRSFSWMTKTPPPAEPMLDIFLRFHGQIRVLWSGRVNSSNTCVGHSEGNRPALWRATRGLHTGRTAIEDSIGRGILQP